MDVKQRRLPTIKDIAEQSRVSRATVSRVLNHHPSVDPALRQRVEEVVERMGYHPNFLARSLRRSGSAFGPPFSEREMRGVDVKRLLAREAARRVTPGQRISVDTGTTVLPLFRFIPADVLSTIEVVTCSVAVAMMWSSENVRPLIRLVGGQYVPEIAGSVGPDTCRWLAEYPCDITFLSTSAIDLDQGLMSYNEYTAQTKRALAAGSRYCVVIADSSKMNRHAPIAVLPFQQITEIITDDGLSADETKQLGSATRLTIVSGQGGDQAM